ncbi:MAG: ABC transporter permease [Fimbriimonas sp.]|nr:ABC transporter permease [Fimbriimonas sp.]
MRSSSDTEGTSETDNRNAKDAQSEVQLSRKRRVLRPLAPSTYLLRNAGKTIPLTAVIVLAVMLVSGIIAMIDSIPYSIRIVYRYAKEETGITPRGDPSLLPQLVSTIKEHSPVRIERIIICRASSAIVRSIVGKWPFVMLGLTQDDMRYYAARQGCGRVIGRYPNPGAPEAIVSRPVAKNLGLKIGSTVLKPDDIENYAPDKIKVVGIAETDRWFMIDSIEYQRDNYFPPVDDALIFAHNSVDQNKLDHWTVKKFKGQRPLVFAYFQIEQNTREMFATLYLILNVVISALALVITFMMGMLMNIYQSQRLVEFGLLQAIGYTKHQLLRRVLLESVSVIALGWLLGLILTFGLLNLASKVLMEPKAYSLDVFDVQAYCYTIPIPLSILIVATFTVILRFRKFDPVGVVERRLV